jgi:hypothetical protein
LEKIPETNIIIFNSISPDKRWKLYKILIKKADKVENFSTESEYDLIQNLEKNILKKFQKLEFLK